MWQQVVYARQAQRRTPDRIQIIVFPVFVQLSVVPWSSLAASVLAVVCEEELLEVRRPLSKHSSVYQAEHRDVASQA